MRYDHAKEALRRQRTSALNSISTIYRFNRFLYRQTIDELVRRVRDFNRAMFELERAKGSTYRFIRMRRT